MVPPVPVQAAVFSPTAAPTTTVRAATFKIASAHVSRQVGRAELARHNTREDCWIAVAGKVYDCNRNGFLDSHPGGVESISMFAGLDATDDFSVIHSKKAWDMLTPLLVMQELFKFKLLNFL